MTEQSKPIPERWRIAYSECTEMTAPRYWQGEYQGSTEHDGRAARLIEELGQAEQDRDQAIAAAQRARQDALKEAIQAVANMPMYQANDGPLQGTMYGAVIAIQALAGKQEGK